VYAGGDGIRALADIFMLVLGVEPYWVSVDTTGVCPSPRGYHTSNLVGDKLVVFGGSDGHECFSDVHILVFLLLTLRLVFFLNAKDLDSKAWTTVSPGERIPRLSHTSTLVGSFLFIFGGHDGSKYSNQVELLNLVTMVWEKREIVGEPPCGRGYHTAILHDSRVFVLGGYDGQDVFSDLWCLELAGLSFLPFSGFRNVEC
jgi:hypothetical protein